MDALSDALRVLKLEGAVFLDAEFTEPWCVLSDPRGVECTTGPDVLFFHVITAGRCKARLADEGEVVELGAGDLLMVPRGHPHLMGSDVGLKPARANKLVQVKRGEDLVHLKFGGGGEKCRFVCGFLSYDARLCGPMLGALPPMARVPLAGGPAAVWLTSLLEIGTRESYAPGPGTESVLSKLSELLFVEALRRYIELLPEQQTGWLAGLRDRFVGRALALLHEHPGRDWTVEQLAESVGLSRSAFAQRFGDTLGEGPMQYLTRWRLTVAAQRLRSEPTALARIAAESGYDSEAAFNRAFKRALGTTPAAWRRAIPDRAELRSKS